MHLIHEYGLVAVAAIIGLECVGLPVPGETALFPWKATVATMFAFPPKADIANRYRYVRFAPSADIGITEPHPILA